MFKRRYFLGLFIVIFIVCGYSFYSVYQEVKKESIRQLNEQQMIYAKLAAKGIKEFFHGIYIELELLSETNNIISLNDNGKSYMKRYQESHEDDIQAITRADATGTIIYTYPDHNRIGANISQVEHVRKLIQTHKPVISDVYLSPRGFQTIIYNVPVFKNGSFDGFIGVLIKFDAIAKKYLENIKIAQTGYAWMISKKGIVLYTPNIENIGKDVFEITSKFPSAVAMVKRMLEGQEGVTTYEWDKIGVKSTQIISKHAVFYPIKIDNTFWSIVVATPENEVLQNISGFRDWWIAIIIFLLVSSIGFSFLYIKAIISIKEEKKRNQLQLALNHSEKIYRLVFDHAPIGVMHYDQNGTITKLNDKFAEIIGAPVEKIIGFNMLQQLTDNKMLEAVTDSLQGKIGYYEGDYLSITANKTTPSRAVYNPILSPEGDILGGISIFEDITERRNAEKILDRSNKLMRNILESISDGFFSLDDDFIITYYNKAAEKLLGRSRMEVIDKNIFDAFPEAKGSIFEKKYSQAIKENNELNFETYFGIKPFENWYDVRVYPLDNGISVYFQVTTERRNAMKMLEEKNIFLQTLIDAIPYPIFYKGIDGLYLGCNNAFEKYINLSKDNIIDKTVYDIYPKDIADKYHALDFNLFQNKSLQILETSIIYADGSQRDVFVHKAPFFKKDGTLDGLIGSFIDITDRKQMEEALKKSEEEKSIILNNMTDMVGYQDIEYHLLWVNDATAKLFNTTPEQIIGQTCYKFFHNLDQPCAGCPVVLAKTTGQIQELEINFPERGSYTIKAIPVKDNNGIIIGIVEMVTDVTEKKKLESQLRQSQKMETIGTLAGGIAHDFNNILWAIMGFTELLLIKTNKESFEHNYLEQILNASHRAKDLVQQILLFSRKSESEYKTIDFVILLKESLKMLRASIPTTVDIRQDIEVDNLTILADPTQMHQVIMNLAGNAAFAMKEKGGLLAFNLTKTAFNGNRTVPHPDLVPGEYLKLAVRDTGHGINSATLTRIFDPFFTTKGVGEGTGMGLSVVHGIIKNHHGAITVYSEEGKGTIFHVYLPIVKTADSIETEKDADILHGNERILIIDDEEMLVRLGESMLGDLGYKVVAETNVINALSTFEIQSDQFDIVITDYAMPHMNGLDLAKKLLEIREDIPIILCTGFADIAIEAKAKSIGIRAMVTKPLSRKEISEKIKEVLDNNSD
jgi:PAS domain S-box-containing protein